MLKTSTLLQFDINPTKYFKKKTHTHNPFQSNPKQNLSRPSTSKRFNLSSLNTQNSTTPHSDLKILKPQVTINYIKTKYHINFDIKMNIKRETNQFLQFKKQ